ncbi:hypothetical protein IFM89_004433 [Coptis chinensis]|uniref:2-oxoglutarate (2OG) and Fe(II)-dependent oxygenase superfamily protein n=1 Tax=Coptis chinensis TaxID=261450 RepID=A0A835GVJ9_9MAGN|nr:hypothetical protein IFM89_004433 [Coptis chinensis]
MAGTGLSSLGRVKLTDLIASEGLPSDSYKISISTLSQSLAQYSAAIIQLPAIDAALLRSGLESARLYFQQRASYPSSDMILANSREWCKTSGYYADPQLWQETYDYRPGLTPTEPNNTIEFPPAGLPDMFSLLGKAARDILDAICFSLNMRSSAFTGILDNVPLKVREISSSVLSVCCHLRPSLYQGAQHHSLATQEDGHLAMFSDHEHQTDKSLITIVKSDRPGLHIRDFHGRWILMDGDLGPQEAVVYPGLALYQATAGYISPAYQRADVANLQGHMYGRCSLAFKLMPKSMASLSCSEMSAAGHGVDAQFQIPIPVDDFMQRSYSNDQIFTRQSFPNYNFPPAQEGSLKPLLKRKKNNNTRCKPLPPSKRLRLEAQRVLKERVQDIADKKGIKLRFCNLKECETHIQALESPCGSIRMEIGWPPGVPFVHPHDLPNKAKLGFLEAYEPGWSSSQDME